MTVREKGVACVMLPTATCSPEGTELKESATVLGCSCTLVEACRPLESVAVSVNSKYDGYSWSCPEKVPLATPTKSCTKCVWQLDGQCWICNVHVNFDVASVPSSASVAEPENEIRSPTFHVSVGRGAVIFGTGGVFETLITCVAVSNAPCESVTLSPTV